jgi:uncharacterized protein YjiS (DUF1127 family)
MTNLQKAARRSVTGAPFRILQALSHLGAVWRTRRDLRRLDAHLLSDIGLTPREASVEADRAVWDAPLHWRC